MVRRDAPYVEFAIVGGWRVGHFGDGDMLIWGEFCSALLGHRRGLGRCMAHKKKGRS